MPHGPGEHQNKNQKPKRKYKIHHGKKHDYYFIYNEDWLKSVLQRICPHCDGAIEQKGIKRLCTTNSKHIELYGNPIPLAYDLTEIIILPPPKYDSCVECGSIKIIDDKDKGEKVCGSCGLVLAGNDPGIIYDWHKYQDTNF